jgi:hypothetical protein
MTPEQIAELQQRIRNQVRKIQVMRASEPEFTLMLENQLVILQALRELLEAIE